MVYLQNGFLTKPIQRVTRYPSLIEKVLKHTWNNHSDYLSIKQALDIACQLNESINKQISEQESSSQLDWLQQHLIFGSAMKILPMGIYSMNY